VVGPGFDTSTYGIAYERNWPYIQDLDVNLLALRQSGDLHHLRKRWFEANVCEEAAETPNALSIESMAGLFLTGGVLLSLRY
jgi:hypothetical protein